MFKTPATTRKKTPSRVIPGDGELAVQFNQNSQFQGDPDFVYQPNNKTLLVNNKEVLLKIYDEDLGMLFLK